MRVVELLQQQQKRENAAFSRMADLGSAETYYKISDFTANWSILQQNQACHSSGFQNANKVPLTVPLSMSFLYFNRNFNQS